MCLFTVGILVRQSPLNYGLIGVSFAEPLVAGFAFGVKGFLWLGGCTSAEPPFSGETAFDFNAARIGASPVT